MPLSHLDWQTPAAHLLRAYLPLLAGIGSQKLAGFAVGVIIARSLGPEAVGDYAKAISLSYMLQFVADLGGNQWLVRRIARQPNAASLALGNVVTCKVCLALPMLFVIILAGAMFGYEGQASDILPLAGASVVAFVLAEVLFSFLQATGRNFSQGAIQIVSGVWTIIAPLAWMAAGYPLTLNIVMICQLAGLSLSVVLAGIAILRTTRPKVQWDFWKLLGESHWLMWQYLSLMVHTQLTIVIVGLLLTPAEVGLFRAAHQLVVPMFLFGGVAFLASNPSLQRSALGPPEKLRDLHRLMVRFLAMIGFPMSVGLFMLAPDVLRLVYGEGFVDAAPVLRWLSFAIAARLLVSSSDGVILATGKIRRWFLISIIPMALDVILVWPLARHWGGEGAGAGLCIAEGIMSIAAITTAAYLVGNWKVVPDIASPALATLVMGTALYTLSGLPVLVLAPLAAVVYAVAILGTRYIGNLVARMNVSPGDPVH